MEIEIKTDNGAGSELEKCIQYEMQEHPWMAHDMAERIAKDNLSKDPNWYEHEQDETQMDGQGEVKDPMQGEESGPEAPKGSDPFSQYGNG